MEKEKNLMISWCYCLGTVLVIFGHSHPLGSTYYPQLLHKIIEFIYLFHMPLFFFLSGFLLEYTGNLKNIQLKKYMKKKVNLLLIPYIFLSIIGIIPKYLLASYTTDNISINFITIIKMIFSPREGVWGHLWFTPTLLVVLLISIFLYKIKNNKIQMIMIFIVFLLNIFPINIDWFAIKDICKELIYSVAGIYFCKKLVNKEDRYFKLKYLLFFLATAISVCYYAIYKHNIYIYIYYVYISWSMIYSILCISYFLKNLKIPNYISDNILTLYLYGWPFQAVLEIFVNKIFKLKWYLIFPSMFIIGIIGPLVMLKIYKKIKIENKLFNLLLGVREKI